MKAQTIILRTVLVTALLLAQFGMPSVARADTCTYVWHVMQDWTTPTAWSCLHVPGSGDTVIVNGDLVENASGTVANVYLKLGASTAATLRTTGDFTVTGEFRIEGGSALELNAPNVTVYVPGTLNLIQGQIRGATDRTLVIQAGGTLNASDTTNTSQNGGNLVNLGTINVTTGTLKFVGGAPYVTTNSGTLNASTGTTLTIQGGALNLNPNSNVLGAGVVRSYATTTAMSGTINTTSLWLGNVDTVDTTIVTGAVNISGTLRWNGGTMSGGGAMTIPAGSTLNIAGNTNGKILNNYTLTNAGAVNWSGAGDIVGSGGAVFNNQAGALFDAQGDADFTYSAPASMPTLNNAGTIRKSGGSGMTTFGRSGGSAIVFNNTGVVQATTGTIHIGGAAATGTSSGNFDAATGTMIEFGGGAHTLANGATMTGAGTFRVSGTTLTLGGNVTGASLEIASGTLNLGSGTLSLGGNLNQTGGTISGGTGTLVFNGGATQNLTLNTATTLNNLTIGSGTTLVETAATDYATVSGALTNNGVIRKTQAVTTTGAKTFGLTGARLNVTTRGTLSSVQVDRVDANHPNAAAVTATGRYWTLTPTGSGYTVDLTLPHNVANQTLAKVCRYTGSAWDCARTSSTTTTVTRANVTTLSDWAVSGLGYLYLPLVVR